MGVGGGVRARLGLMVADLHEMKCSGEIWLELVASKESVVLRTPQRKGDAFLADRQTHRSSTSVSVLRWEARHNRPAGIALPRGEKVPRVVSRKAGAFGMC